MDRVTQLGQFLASDPNNLPLACDFLDAVLAQGRWNDSMDVIERLRSVHGQDLGFLRRIARFDLLSGDLEAASSAYRRLLSADPRDAAARHDLGFALLAAGDVDAAEALLADGRSDFDRWPELAVLWARTAYLRKDPAEALARVASVTSSSAARALEALIRWDEGENDVARALASEALAANPRDTDARLVMASDALVDRDGRRAIEWIAPVVEHQPRHGRALSVFGQALLLVGDQAGGRQALIRAVECMPDHIGTWHVLAWVHLLAGEVDLAQSAYEQAYAIDRNFGETHGGLALINVLRGEREEAQVAVRRALRLDPNSATAQLATVLMVSDTANAEAAAASLTRAMRALPELVGIEPEAVLKGLQARLKGQGARP